MRLIITRHGETEENKKGIFQGHLPGTLSKEGILQARKIAQRLKDEKIDIIYSSDLARAADTAKLIANFHHGIELLFVKELRERHLGSLQGKSKKELGVGRKAGSADVKHLQKGGETIEEVYLRAEKFLDKILHRHKRDTVLFVGHNGIDKAIISVITGKGVGGITSMESLKNTSVNIYEIDEYKNHKVHLFNCIKHLA